MDEREIILSNFVRNDTKLAALWEIRMSHLVDWAKILAPLCVDDADAEDDPFMSAFASLREGLDRAHAKLFSELLPSERESISKAVTADSARILAELCRFVTAGHSHGLNELPIQEIEQSKIAYFPTKLSDGAWRLLSDKLPRTSPMVTDGFSAACEEVYNGHCDFCLLPFYGKDEGVLLPFFRLVKRYELIKVLSVEIFSADSEQNDRMGHTIFGLYGSKMQRIQGADQMDICLHVSSNRLWTVLDGLHQLGTFCERLTSLPDSIFEEEVYLLTLRLQGVEPNTVLRYLSLCTPAYTLNGVYRCLNRGFG